jgi:hypothetical protein
MHIYWSMSFLKGSLLLGSVIEQALIELESLAVTMNYPSTTLQGRSRIRIVIILRIAIASEHYCAGSGINGSQDEEEYSDCTVVVTIRSSLSTCQCTAAHRPRCSILAANIC